MKSSTLPPPPTSFDSFPSPVQKPHLESSHTFQQGIPPVSSYGSSTLSPSLVMNKSTMYQPQFQPMMTSNLHSRGYHSSESPSDPYSSLPMHTTFNPNLMMEEPSDKKFKTPYRNLLLIPLVGVISFAVVMFFYLPLHAKLNINMVWNLDDLKRVYGILKSDEADQYSFELFCLFCSVYLFVSLL